MTPRAHLSVRRAGLAFATVFATLATLVLSHTSATPAETTADEVFVATSVPTPQTMLVIGDSYSSYYGDRTTPYPGWWALVGTHLGLEPVLDAQAGTGFLARNRFCSGSRYAERLDSVRRVNPRVLFIEGGRNDWRRCTRDGAVVEATRTQIVRAVERYFTDLANTWDQMGRDRTDVYVLSPWGDLLGAKASVIRPMIREAAERQGFAWIPTRRLSRDLAPDGIHPENAGNRFLRDEVLENSDLLARFGRA